MSALAWRCRSCAAGIPEPYRYPPTPDVYCAGCGAALEAAERIAAALAALAQIEPVPAGGLSKPLLDSDEAAALLGTTRKGLDALRRRGKLPTPVGPGRRLLFRREDLLASTPRVPSPGRSRR